MPLGQEAQSALGIDMSGMGVGLNADNKAAYDSYIENSKKIENKISGMETARQSETDAITTRRNAAQAERDSFASTGPTHVQLPSVPQFKPTDISEHASGLLALAAFAGLAARQPLTAALNNLAGVMKGVNTGDQQLFERSWKEYEANYKKAAEINKEALAEYDKVLNRKDKNIEQMDKELHYLDVKYGQQIGATLREQQGLTKALEVRDKLVAAQDRAQQQRDSLEERRQNHQDNMAIRQAMLAQKKESSAAAGGQGVQQLTPEGMRLMSEMRALGLQLPISGWGGKALATNIAIINDMASRGMTAAQIASDRAGYKANQTSLNALTKKYDSISSTLESFHNNIATWESIAEGQVPKLGGEKFKELGDKLKKIDFVGIASLDEALIRAKAQFDDPASAAYLTASFTVAMDYARIMASQGQSAAQVAEGARKEALHIIKAGYNKDARKALIGTLESDTAGQLKGIEDSMQNIQKRIGSGTGGQFAGSDGSGSAPASGAPKNGDKAMSKTGKPIVFRNGQWEYE